MTQALDTIGVSSDHAPDGGAGLEGGIEWEALAGFGHAAAHLAHRRACLGCEGHVGRVVLQNAVQRFGREEHVGPRGGVAQSELGASAHGADRYVGT